MDELIGRLAAKAGIDSAVAEKTIGIILGFLRNEGPSDKVQALIDEIPGAEAAISASGNGGGLGRLMGGGLMALGTKLMGLGLGMSEIQSVALKDLTIRLLVRLALQLPLNYQTGLRHASRGAAS